MLVEAMLALAMFVLGISVTGDITSGRDSSVVVCAASSGAVAVLVAAAAAAAKRCSALGEGIDAPGLPGGLVLRTPPGDVATENGALSNESGKLEPETNKSMLVKRIAE